MDGVIIPCFQKFKAEGEIIGRLVVGYGDIELDLCNCVAMGIEDFDLALKAMYRPRGESARIEVADTIGRRAYVALGLGQEFDTCLTDLRFCLKLRDRYAHSQLYDDNSGQLAIVVLEEEAKKKTVVKDLTGLTTRHLTKEILRNQELYFLYARACIGYINYEGRFLRKQFNARLYNKPVLVARPQEYA